VLIVARGCDDAELRRANIRAQPVKNVIRRVRSEAVAPGQAAVAQTSPDPAARAERVA
jgi:hypothetical protein